MKKITVVASIICLLITAVTAWANGGSVKGEVGYSQKMAWDYDKDGEVEHVQYWVEIDIESDGKEVKGGLIRFMKDLDSGRKIYQWVGMQMTGENMKPQQKKATNLSITGKTARFTLDSGMSYTIADQSVVPEQPPAKFLSDDGYNKTEFPILGGGVTVLSN